MTVTFDKLLNPLKYIDKRTRSLLVRFINGKLPVSDGYGWQYLCKKGVAKSVKKGYSLTEFGEKVVKDLRNDGKNA